MMEYVDGGASATDPTTWCHFEAVRRWFRLLPAGSRVEWTDHSQTWGPWVITYADVVVPALEEVAHFNWVWTAYCSSDERPVREWQLVIKPDLRLWELWIDRLPGYVTDQDPGDVSNERLDGTRRCADEMHSGLGEEEWRAVTALSHGLINRVLQEWVAQHCNRLDLTFAFNPDLEGRMFRMMVDLRRALDEEPHGWGMTVRDDGRCEVSPRGGSLPQPLIVLIDDARSFTDSTEALAARCSENGVRLLELLRGEPIAELWLDHDLGDDDTLRPVVELLERAAHLGERFDIGRVYVHSTNPPGAVAVLAALERAGCAVATSLRAFG